MTRRTNCLRSALARFAPALLAPALLLALASCRGAEPAAEADPAQARAAEPEADPGSATGSAADLETAADPEAAANPATDAPLVVFLGDSLTAGYLLEEQQAFPHLVGEAMATEGPAIRVVNAGVSGDTTAGGLSRLGWLLRQEPDIVVVGLGGNDGLRGLDLAASESNLRQIVTRCREAGADVLLLGMLIPPNYGPEYTEEFAAMYPRLAAELGAPLVPFLLEGVAGDPALNLADGIHPTPEGHEIVAATVVRHLRPMVERRLSGGS